MKKFFALNRAMIITIVVIGILYCNVRNVIAGGYLTSAATQASTSAVFASETNREIICVSVTATSGAGNCQVSQMQFTMQNTNSADVLNAKLYYTGTSSIFATTTQYGSTINNPNGTITFNFTSATHSNSTYYYWLSFDIAGTPTLCDLVDAFVPANGITIIGTGAGTKTPTTPDPSGSRKIAGPGCWDYCVPDFSASVYSITKVELNSINNNTASISGGASPGYEDFTDLSTSLIPEGTYQMTVNATGAGPSNTFYVNAFFDWNNDGDFIDAGEEYQLGTFASNSGIVSGIIVVPANASIGLIRMRVISKYNLYSLPCNTTGNGQAEDYSINVCSVDAGSIIQTSLNICPVPGTTTISIAGNSVGSSIQWEVSSDNINFSDVTDGTGATTQTYTTGALGAGTYYYRARVYGSCESYTGSCVVLVNPAICSPSDPFVTGFEACDMTMNSEMTVGNAISNSGALGPNSGIKHAYIQGLTGGGGGQRDGSFITASPIVLVPGRVYTMSVWAKWDGGVGVSANSKIKFAKSATPTNAAMKSATGSDVMLNEVVSSSSYILYSVDFSVSSAEQKYIGIQLYAPAVTGCAGQYYFIDDVMLTSVCAQCNNGIQDGDETGIDCGGSMCYTGAPVSGSISPAGPITAACPSSSSILCLSGSTGSILWQRSPTGADPWYDISGANSTTYSAITSDPMYFRAKVSKDGCSGSVYSNSVFLNVTGFTTKTFNVASGSWGTATNWTPNGVPTTCDNVIIPSTSTVTITPNAECHNLQVDGTLSISFSSGKYLYVYGNIVNNGTITQSSASSANSQGDCNPCSGLSLKGLSTTWGGVDNYPLLTVSVGDNSDVFMINDATIDFLDATKTAAIGRLSIGAGNTLKITNAFAQSESEVHVNTGTLWLALQNSMKIGITSLFPEMGTVFFDFQGTSALSGPWDRIGGSGFYNLKLRQNAGSCYISCKLNVRNDLIIESSASAIRFLYCSVCSPLPTLEPYTVKVHHDWINNDNDGTPFSMTNGFTVIMEGTTEQNITGTASTTYSNLKINNNSSTGVVLQKPTILTDTLTLSDGIIFSDATNILSLTSTAVSNAGSAQSFVDGPMKKTGNTAFVFPLGDGAVWAPFGIAVSTDVTNSYTTEYFRSGAPNNTSSFMNVGLHHVSYLEYWNINKDAGTEYPAVSLYWKPGVDHGISNLVADPLTVAHWNTGISLWDDMGVSFGSGSTNSAGFITSTTAFSSYSPMTFGSKTGINPLPVELLRFNAAPENMNVKVMWATMAEINNDYFTVERCKNNCFENDYKNWEVIATVDGAGNSNQQIDYSTYDKNPFMGTSYYRLKQTDYDGQSKYSNTVAVQFNSEKMNFVNVYPNPSDGTFNIDLGGFEINEHLRIVLYNSIGNIVNSTNIITSETGDFSTKVNSAVKLSKGIYLLEIVSAKSVINRKIIIR